MYKCKECGAIFEYPAEVVDKVPYGSGSADWVSYACPECGDDSFDDIDPCACCGEYEETNDFGLCKNCANELKEKLEIKWQEVQELCDEYGVDDYDVINEVFV